MSEQLSENDGGPAYVCGRLLCVFEEIQYAALGDVNSNVVDKFYGTFSAAPGLLMSRLYANARNHLRKLRTEADKQKSYRALDRRLTEVTALLKGPPPGQLPLQQQALFALGYYPEKARGYARRAAAKAAKLKAAQAAATKS